MTGSLSASPPFSPLDSLCQALYDHRESARVGTSSGQEIEVQWVEFVPDNGGIRATLRTVGWDNNQITDIKEQEVLFADATACQNTDRVFAWAIAYFQALSRLMHKRVARAQNPDWLMPRDFLDDALKLKRPVTQADFERVMLRRYP